MRRFKKHYQTPSHPWNKTRIEEERVITHDFGVRNKREIYKMGTVLKRYKDLAKTLLARKDKQAEIERGHLMTKLTNLGLIQPGAQLDDILSLQLRDVMDRRLQSIMVRKNLARTTLQARQFIVHKHVLINEKQITSPSYLVPLAEEGQITFAAKSALSNEDHPERPREEDLQKIKEAKARKSSDNDETPSFDEEEVKKVEAETT
ncbi:MAG: 30S ribosomal protein S4 [Nitrosarchaeum sp.]|nr:30S ribosomal protein S4 [Nitrosarchaeum sp.]